jgi:TrbM
MNNRVISALALAVALASSSAASAQSSNNYQLPEGYDPAGYNPNASSGELPEGYDPAGNNSNTTNGQLPDGYDSTVNTTTTPSLPNDMQATVDSLTQQQQGQMLEGDEGSACEAILCLSSGSSPSECMPSLRKYFSINLSKPWKTIQARINFLKLCPTSNDTPQMGTLVEAIGHGAGRCDAATLNATLRTWTGIDGEYEISNQMPSYCDAYFTHEYTDIDNTKPYYVEKYVESSYADYEGNTVYQYAGGYWVDGGSSAKVAANANGAIPASKDPAAIGF